MSESNTRPPPWVSRILRRHSNLRDFGLYQLPLMSLQQLCQLDSEVVRHIRNSHLCISGVRLGRAPTSKIDTMDNGTMVEAFKYLNYCQLAKSSLISMRFRNLIQTHRHKLALLYVSGIDMVSITDVPHVIKVFDKKLSSDAYNDWVIRNQYSKEVPLEDQVACTESTQSIPNGYCLNAEAYYKDPNHREWNDRTTVFFAKAELNHENWPLFQHFVRLATDPFIYIDCMGLTYQNAVLNSLSGAVNPNRRLQCKELHFNLKGNTQKSLTWTKNHVRCNQLWTYGKVDLNQDEALLDFFVTGGHCTSVFGVGFCAGFSKTADNFVQV
ncbi:hypothetical protein Ddc_22535 [Ditylenchus destructor]|nr:hypothetical protein Ddc_22535 [Ditylenchus destructor]